MWGLAFLSSSSVKLMRKKLLCTLSHIGQVAKYVCFTLVDRLQPENVICLLSLSRNPISFLVQFSFFSQSTSDKANVQGIFSILPYLLAQRNIHFHNELVQVIRHSPGIGLSIVHPAEIRDKTSVVHQKNGNFLLLPFSSFCSLFLSFSSSAQFLDKPKDAKGSRGCFLSLYYLFLT